MPWGSSNPLIEWKGAAVRRSRTEQLANPEPGNSIQASPIQSSFGRWQDPALVFAWRDRDTPHPTDGEKG